MDSTLHSFLFDKLPVRGALVRLRRDWQTLIARRLSASTHSSEHQVIPLIQLLGQITASAVLLQNSIRFEGRLSLQIQGDGPIRLALAQVEPDLSFRSTWQCQPDFANLIKHSTSWESLVHGHGRCALTLEPQHAHVQAYQGLVELDVSDTLDADISDEFTLPPSQGLARALGHYMAHSEQIPSYFVLLADADIAAGLLIQRMPIGGAHNLVGQGQYEKDTTGLEQANEDFSRIAWLASTVQPSELSQLDAGTLMQRLFAQEAWTCHTPRYPRFACSCSRERVGSLLHALGPDELQALVAEQGGAQVRCEFCGQAYDFTPEQALALTA
jgi:molecular chaperone Hsp33